AHASGVSPGVASNRTLCPAPPSPCAPCSLPKPSRSHNARRFPFHPLWVYPEHPAVPGINRPLSLHAHRDRGDAHSSCVLPLRLTQLLCAISARETIRRNPPTLHVR